MKEFSESQKLKRTIHELRNKMNEQKKHFTKRLKF